MKKGTGGRELITIMSFAYKQDQRNRAIAKGHSGVKRSSSKMLNKNNINKNACKVLMIGQILLSALYRCQLNYSP
jgi:hypothetical protein